MLLGLLREDPTLSMRFLRSHTMAETILKDIKRHRPPEQKISTSVDLPLSNESKHVLAYAAEEAERLGHEYIGTEQLLLGILREEHSFAAMLLQRHGVEAQVVRTVIAKHQPAGPPRSARNPAILGFIELVLKVTNLEASIDFYVKLGFTQAGDRGPGTAVLTNGKCHLRLQQNPRRRSPHIFPRQRHHPRSRAAAVRGRSIRTTSTNRIRRQHHRPSARP